MPKYKSYVVTQGEATTEVRCKGCGVVIRKLIPVESFGAVERINGQVIVRERLLLTCLPNYREVMVEFDDSTKHVTCLCDQCAQKMDDATFAQNIYHQDLDQFEAEGMKCKHGERHRKLHKLLKIAPQVIS